MTETASPQFFSEAIIVWYEIHRRDLPWRETADPYKIWLSEIILQQTRVQQGLPYYIKFITQYPDVQSLAVATANEILHLWQGLGYYSRGRNLLKAAQMIVNDYQGVFPKNYQELRKLKGVGEYTASAIASFCYAEPRPVIDGNVYRVLARYLGITTPMNSSEGIKIFREYAHQLMDESRIAIYNQAIMEFGALQCKPKNPLCEDCPLAQHCVAYNCGKVQELPIKIRKLKIKKRYFNYLVIYDQRNQIIVQQRVGSGIWQGLYEFPLIETPNEYSLEEVEETSEFKSLVPTDYQIISVEHSYRTHKLTHQHIYTRFVQIKLEATHLKGVSLKDLKQYPMPVLMLNFLKEIL